MDLFGAARQQLPLLNMSLPIAEAYMVIPWIVVLIHSYLSLQLCMLAISCRNYRYDLEHYGSTQIDRRLLSHFFLVQIFSGARGNDVIRTAMWVIFCSTVYLLPIFVMVLIEVRFSAYHSAGISVLHQIAITVDVAMPWAFWFVAIRRSTPLIVTPSMRTSIVPTMSVWAQGSPHSY